jgi:hypothetical protein
MQTDFINDSIKVRVLISFQPDYVRQNFNSEYNRIPKQKSVRNIDAYKLKNGH